MSKVNIQIQSILYNNDKCAIEKAINHIDNAIKVYEQGGGDISCALYYGDASPDPIFSEEDITNINARFHHISKIESIFFDENTGTAKGHNRLATKSESEYIMVMNPDVLVNPRFFLEMLEGLKDDTVGMVEARQTPIEHPKEYDKKTFETSWSTTACVIFRRCVFEKIHGFDEQSFFMYCDDVDFSWRIRLEGYKLIYRPSAVVYHAKRLSSGGSWKPTSAEIYYSAEAALFMAYKWSQQKLLKKLLFDFKHSKEKVYNDAAREFERRRRNGNLPNPLDEEHKIATFVEGGYAKHRFNM